MTDTPNLPATIDANVLDNFDGLDVDTVLRILTGDLTVVETSSEEVSRDMMRRVLEAPDVITLLDETPGTIGSDTLIGRVLSFDTFSLRPSNIGEQGGVWMAVEATDPKSGERFVMSTSSRTIMAQLARARWLGALPLLAKIKRADKATASGYYPLSLTHPM